MIRAPFQNLPAEALLALALMAALEPKALPIDPEDADELLAALADREDDIRVVWDEVTRT